MDRRYIGVIIIILGLVIIAGIIYVIFFLKFSPASQTALEEQAVTPVALTQTPEPIATTTAEQTTVRISPIKKTEVGQEDLVRIATAFSERFGSFSNQSDYGNVRDLKIFMSTKMQNWADSYISQARAKPAASAIYYGITTKAIASAVRQFSSETGQAEIFVKTQRREASGTTANATTFYQDIVIKFVRERGIWKVDSALWQKR